MLVFFKRIISQKFDNLRKSSLKKQIVIEPAQTLEKVKKNRPKMDGIFIGTTRLANIGLTI